MAEVKIGIIGGGSWGTALASVLARNKVPTVIWSRNSKIIDSINNTSINTAYFPDIKLDSLIKATTDFRLLNECQYLFLVIPVQAIREFLREYKIANDIPIVLCSKGIDIETLQFPSQIVQNFIDNETLVLSGPNFASEVIRNMPTFSNLFATSASLLAKVARLLNQETFQVTCYQDKIGAQICGAVKNVIAIACGLISGKKLGENAKAALITSGLKEIALLIKVLKGDSATAYLLAGMGDILLTCTGNLSRNTRYGISLITNNTNKNETVEGIYTSKAVYLLSEKYGISLPICYAVYQIIYLQRDIDTTINNLLNNLIQ